jgi:putative DNA primase/helicase
LKNNGGAEALIEKKYRATVSPLPPPSSPTAPPPMTQTPRRRPPLVSPRLAEIPESLKSCAQWVVWEAVWREDASEPTGGEWLPMPYSARNGTRLSPGTLERQGATFTHAADAFQKGGNAGVGFVLGQTDPFAIIEVPEALDENGRLNADAARVLAALDSYAELSSSGRGLRIWVRGNLPPGGRRRENIEMYEAERFVPVSGCRWESAPSEVWERQAELEQFHRDCFPALPSRRPPGMAATNRPGPHVTDAQMLIAAFRGPNGSKIETLYKRADTSLLPGDRNAADLTLCSLLSYYTGDDPARLDRLFRSSALFRPKWDVAHYSDGATYGAATVARALEGCIAFHAYPPPSPVEETEKNEAPADDTARLPKPNFPELVPLLEQPYVALANGAALKGISPAPIHHYDPLLLAETQGRAQGLAMREQALCARDAAQVLGISVRMLRRYVQPWRRFGSTAEGDRWLFSELVRKEPG